MDHEDWLKCDGKRRDLSYNLFSGAAFAHHLLLDPLLDTYEFTFKIDVDVNFLEQPDVDPVLAMQSADCAVLHTRLWPGESHHDCQEDAFEYTVEFGKLINYGPRSAQYDWCKKTDYFYANFLGLSSAVFRSPAAKLFNRWLYECTTDRGYFRHRWGDQASYPMYVCQWLDVPNVWDDPQICDFSRWRNKVFFHPER
jgi:hypothetical protein